MKRLQSLHSTSSLSDRRTSQLHSKHFLAYYYREHNYINKTMALYRIILVLTIIATLAAAQRPFYAGLRPIGYPQVESDFLANRFGSDEPGPLEFQGDPNYRNRIQQLPQDQQPFWYLNWQQYDALRKNPQTFPQRPSVFNNNIEK